MTNDIDILLSKIPLYSHMENGIRCWNSDEIERYRQYVMRYLKRNSWARNTMMDVPRKYNNNTAILESFSKRFVLNLPIKLV